MIYTIPTFHAPTGTVMPLSRRKELVALAQQWQVMVLEDNCYYEFDYDDAPPPTLLAFDDSGFVLQSDSFSKYVAPGLRMAWVAGDPAAITAIVRVRQDFAVSQLLARRSSATSRTAISTRISSNSRITIGASATSPRKDCARTASHGFAFVNRVVASISGSRSRIRVDWDAARRVLAEKGVAFRAG